MVLSPLAIPALLDDVGVGGAEYVQVIEDRRRVVRPVHGGELGAAAAARSPAQSLESRSAEHYFGQSLGPLRYWPSSTVTRSGTGVRRFASSWSVECHTAAESLAPGCPMAPRMSCSWAVMSPSGALSAAVSARWSSCAAASVQAARIAAFAATAEPGDLSRRLSVGGWPCQTPARPVLGHGHHVRHHVANRPAGTGRELSGPCRVIPGHQCGDPLPRPPDRGEKSQVHQRRPRGLHPLGPARRPLVVGVIGVGFAEPPRRVALAVFVVPVPPFVWLGLRVAGGGVLPILLASQRGHVEEAPGVHERPRRRGC